MSNSILDQLESKPVPKKQQRIQIFVPQEGQVAIKAQIVDLRDKGYDRSALKKRLKSTGILIGLTKERPDHPHTSTTKRPAPSTSAKPPIKIKKLKKRLRIHKSTGTITQLTKPAKGPIKIRKRSRKLPQVAEEDMIFDMESIAERLPSEMAPLHIKANAYYMNNREIFINFINSLFGTYRDAILDESKEISCESKGGEFFSPYSSRNCA